MSKNTKKRFFSLIIGGIIAIFLLIMIIFFTKKSNYANNNQETYPETNRLAQEVSSVDKEQNNCPYLNEQNLTIHSDTDSKLCKALLHQEDLPKWRQIPLDYIIKLWKKGYHWNDILQLWDWKIPEPDIPNLKAEKAVGVINTLSYLLGFPCSVVERIKTMSKEEKKAWIKKMENEEIGSSAKMIFIVRKSSAPILNLDEKIQSGTSPYGDTLKYVKKLIEFVLQQENINPQQYEITLLSCIGSENFGREGDVKHGTVMGKSIGVAYYLGLLSSIHQKSINQAVAATGFINLKERKAKISDQEVRLLKGAVLPIGGVKAKCFAATEKGFSRLVLSKYQSSPNLLSEKAKYDPMKEVISEEYQQVVPNEIKEKMRVYFAGNISELRELLLGGELS